MRFFNTAGPIRTQDHYFIPHRLDWGEVSELIERKQYFVLHAPRQSGKTTAIEEYIDWLNKVEERGRERGRIMLFDRFFYLKIISMNSIL